MKRVALCFLGIILAAVGGASAIGLTVSNPNPQIGEEVTFEITGVSGDIEAHWDFGGAGCAPYTQTFVCEPIYTNCHASTYKYSTAGAKTATVTAYDPDTGATIGSAVVNLTVQTTGTCGGCSYTLSPTSLEFPAAGGTGTFNVATEAGCGWTADPSQSWISITSGGSGTGPGTVNYSVDANPGTARQGSIDVENRLHTISQAGEGSIQLDFTISDTTPDIGQTVFFDIIGVPGEIDSATWNFGGTGCSPYTQNYTCIPDQYTDCMSASYAYAAAGIRTVTLTVVYEAVSYGPAAHSLTVSATGSCGGGGGGGGSGSATEYKLIASDAVGDEFFGGAVAVDGRTIVVGSERDFSNGGTLSGSAFIYQPDSTGDWENYVETKLPSPVPGPSQYFGHAVDIDGDTIAVGGHQSVACSGSSLGAVFIYQDTSASGNWSSFSQTLVCPTISPSSGMHFGSSVALHGRVLVVGARQDPSSGDDAGAVYLYQDTSGAGNWTSVTETKILASDGEAGDFFGHSVSLTDGVIAVGAYGSNDSGSQSGSVYLLLDTSPPQNWSSIWEYKIVAPDAAATDRFGWDVAIQGSTLIVGAPEDYDAGHRSGSVYVLQDTSPDGNWLSYSVTKILPSDGRDFDEFGYSVAIDNLQLVVGAYQGGDIGIPSGAAYLFFDTSPDGDWSEYDEVKLVPSDANEGDWFGYSVAVNDETTAVGSPHDTNEGGIGAGAAYLYVQPVRILFEDGFESGDTSLWSATVP